MILRFFGTSSIVFSEIGDHVQGRSLVPLLELLAKISDEGGLDLVFLNSAYFFELVLRQIVQLERFSNRRAVILIANPMPPDALAASRTKAKLFWCGDVWNLEVGRDDQ